MIYLTTALYYEAEPLIRLFMLEKDNTFHKIQVFSNEKFYLIVTGVGAIQAAVAIAIVCSSYPPKKGDFLINIGVCGARTQYAPIGTIFCCNKICEKSSRRCFYPDMLYSHPFKENTVLTCSIKQTKKEMEQERETLLFDMEAFGVFQSGVYFFSTHQIIVLKIVSDYGDNTITPEVIKQLIEQNIEKIEEFFYSLNKIQKDISIISEKEEDYLKKLSTDMYCSVTMESLLRQYFCYCKLSDTDFCREVDLLYKQGVLPCKNKKEGKGCFEKLKERLL